MAEDYRRITLTPKEFLLALDAHRRATTDFLPCGEILNYELLPEETLNVTVRMSYGKNINELKFSYKFLEILPVLQKFCVENNIHLPANGRRFVTSENNFMSIAVVCET